MGAAERIEPPSRACQPRKKKKKRGGGGGGVCRKGEEKEREGAGAVARKANNPLNVGEPDVSYDVTRMVKGDANTVAPPSAFSI